MTSPLLRIGARGSALSVAQTEGLRIRLAAHLGVSVEAIAFTRITTTGDKLSGPLVQAGGKGLFTKELDEALLDGRIDLAVHSLKDVPTRLPDTISLACTPQREDPCDAFVSLKAKKLADLPAGAVIGTASLRRQAQALFVRPDLKVATLRGNVDTRLAKLAAGEVDATFLALSGLKRLGLESRATSLVDPHAAPPAACQGALAVTARADDARTLAALAGLEDAATRIEIETERAFLESLDGSCRTPIGALARVSGAALSFVGETLTPDGALRWRREETISLGAAAAQEARALGRRLAHSIRDEAGDAIRLGEA